MVVACSTIVPAQGGIDADAVAVRERVWADTVASNWIIDEKAGALIRTNATARRRVLYLGCGAGLRNARAPANPIVKPPPGWAVVPHAVPHAGDLSRGTAHLNRGVGDIHIRRAGFAAGATVLALAVLPCRLERCRALVHAGATLAVVAVERSCRGRASFRPAAYDTWHFFQAGCPNALVEEQRAAFRPEEDVIGILGWIQ